MQLGSTRKICWLGAKRVFAVFATYVTAIFGKRRRFQTILNKNATYIAPWSPGLLHPIRSFHLILFWPIQFVLMIGVHETFGIEYVCSKAKYILWQDMTSIYKVQVERISQWTELLALTGCAWRPALSPEVFHSQRILAISTSEAQTWYVEAMNFWLHGSFISNIHVSYVYRINQSSMPRSFAFWDVLVTLVTSHKCVSNLSMISGQKKPARWSVT